MVVVGLGSGGILASARWSAQNTPYSPHSRLNVDVDVDVDVNGVGNGDGGRAALGTI
jgi:hypothetical protein